MFFLCVYMFGRKKKARKLEELSNEFQTIYIDDEKRKEYFQMAKNVLPAFPPNYFLRLVNKCHENGLYGKEAEEYIDKEKEKYLQDRVNMAR